MLSVPACPQEALADGLEGLLALQEALERTVDAARGLLERAEVAAAEAEDGEVGGPTRTMCSFACCPFFFGKPRRTGDRRTWMG